MLNFLSSISVTDWLAVAVVVGLIVVNFGSQILAWIQAHIKTGGNPTPTTTDVSADLRKKFELWLQIRALPDLSPEAVKDLELLKNELIKWE